MYNSKQPIHLFSTLYPKLKEVLILYKGKILEVLINYFYVERRFYEIVINRNSTQSSISKRASLSQL